MPDPKAGESQSEFVARFMKSEEANNSFASTKQRLAVAFSKYRRRGRKKRERRS